METFGQIIGFVVSIILFRLAFKFFAKEKFPTATLIASMGVIILFCSFPWFQGFVKTWVVSDVNSKLAELGQQVNTVQTATTEMHSQLAKHQTQIDEHQKELGEVQIKIRNAQSDVANQQTNITQQYEQISTVQRGLILAQTNLDIQGKKISDVEYLVDNLFSKMTNEDIPGSDTNRVFHISTHGTVFFKLESVPIHNSVHIVLVKTETGNSPLLLNNIQFFNVISFNFTGNWDSDWKDGDFNIEYVKDTRQTNIVHSIETTTNQLILDQVMHEQFD